LVSPLEGNENNGLDVVFRALLDFTPSPMQNSRMPDETSQRMEKLESHVAHLEHQVEQLNEVVIEQGKLLDKLKKEIQRQSSSLQTMELERVRANVQKPPHYQ
jgi:SlyX protein